MNIARALQKITTLEQLYINNNKITDEGSDEITAICSYNTQIQVLHLIIIYLHLEKHQHCKELLNSNVDIM